MHVSNALKSCSTDPNEPGFSVPLTDFESGLLGGAVVVNLAHKCAHLHRVLVLVVQPICLEKGNEENKLQLLLHLPRQINIFLGTIGCKT